jgi:hypothetical protein
LPEFIAKNVKLCLDIIFAQRFQNAFQRTHRPWPIVKRKGYPFSVTEHVSPPDNTDGRLNSSSSLSSTLERAGFSCYIIDIDNIFMSCPSFSHQPGTGDTQSNAIVFSLHGYMSDQTGHITIFYKEI